MNTWVAHAALGHVTLTMSIGPVPAFGSVSLYSFALGASAAVLALVMVRSPRQLSFRWRPGGLARRRVRQRKTARTSPANELDDTIPDSVTAPELAVAEPAIADPAVDGEEPCALDQAGARRTSRLRQRVDLMLLQMLGDDEDQPLSPSKHRSAEPAKQPQHHKHAPRHARG